MRNRPGRARGRKGEKGGVSVAVGQGQAILWGMPWWSRLLGGSDRELKPQRLDYLSEALALERQGDYDAALTSYRLALRDQPDDARVLQNMAIAYSRTGRQDEAVRAYRRALEVNPLLAGAHYGLAFLLLKRDDRDGAMTHLRKFLAHPPIDSGAEQWIQHAEQTIAALEGGDANDGTASPSDAPATDDRTEGAH